MKSPDVGLAEARMLKGRVIVLQPEIGEYRPGPNRIAIGLYRPVPGFSPEGATCFVLNHEYIHWILRFLISPQACSAFDVACELMRKKWERDKDPEMEFWVKYGWTRYLEEAVRPPPF